MEYTYIHTFIYNMYFRCFRLNCEAPVKMCPSLHPITYTYIRGPVKKFVDFWMSTNLETSKFPCRILYINIYLMKIETNLSYNYSCYFTNYVQNFSHLLLLTILLCGFSSRSLVKSRRLAEHIHIFRCLPHSLFSIHWFPLGPVYTEVAHKGQLVLWCSPTASLDHKLLRWDVLPEFLGRFGSYFRSDSSNEHFHEGILAVSAGIFSVNR